jgi:hypothetical protein
MHLDGQPEMMCGLVKVLINRMCPVPVKARDMKNTCSYIEAIRRQQRESASGSHDCSDLSPALPAYLHY